MLNNPAMATFIYVSGLFFLWRFCGYLYHRHTVDTNGVSLPMLSTS